MVFLSCFFVYEATAQQPSFRAITTDQDLPSNEVYSILQDKQGFIWIGCDVGLFRYNGIKFILYKTPKQKSKSITGLVEAPDGRIYCHNFTGQVFYIEANQMFELDCFNATYISNITTNHKNELWVVTQEGLAYYSPQTKTCQNYEGTKGVSRNFTDTNGNIWATASDFIGKIDSKKKLTIYPARKDAIDEFDHFIIGGNGEEKILITITTGNIYKLFGDTFVKHNLLPLKKALKGKKVTNVFSDTQGKLWITTYTGMVVYDFKTTQAQVFLEQFSFSDILQDTNGAMWLTTLYDGVLYIPTMTFENWQTIEKILKICHNDGKKVYVGNSSGTLGELDTESKQLKVYNVGTKSDIRSLNYDKIDQSVYFNVNSSLYSLKNEQISVARPASHSVKNLIHTPEGYVVASSAKTYFVKKLDMELSQTVNEQWGRSLEYDAKHQKVWVATNKGLLKLIYQNDEYIIQDKLLQDQQVLDISLWTEKGFVFAVTFEGFVYQINHQESIEPIAQLPENVQAYNILFHQEKLFIGTNKGLWVYDLKHQKWQKISTLEGLISDNVLSFTILKDKIWLGTAKGVQSLPLNYNLEKELPKIYLRKFLLNNQEHKNLQNLQIQASDSLKIYVEAVSYPSGDKFQYAYRLNKSSVWSYLPASTEAISLNALPVGEFLLEIKVLDHLGRDSGNMIILKGEVLPHIWQRGWFLGLAILVLGGLIWLLFRFRIRRLQQKQEQTLRQISLENELKLWQQTALQVQMNPHFLFNILNSIKAYIYENDKQKAIRYLNHFANLVRKILHNSNQKLITLAEELEVISHYIELEAMLLEENFTWKINIPENIPTTDIYIPTLLIQPFVENAFKHGLRHQKGIKELWISVAAENEKELKIVIEDNGIGRKQAAEINRKQKPLHQSFATQNIEQRMKLINQNHDFELSIETIDKENTEKEPLGTKIIVTVRYKDETITQA